MSIFEFVISVLLLVSASLIIYFIFKQKLELYDEGETDRYSLEFLCENIKNIINDIINMDIDALNLNKKDYISRQVLKRSLSDAIRNCSQGNLSQKIIVIARIKSSLTNILGVSEEVIDKVISFDNPDELSSALKFAIMMYLEKREGSSKMFRGICKKTGLDQQKKDEEGFYYRITKEDIDNAYDRMVQPLSYDDKLNILTQRVYEETYGLSAVDLLVMEDDSLDSVSGGISGITKEDYRFMEEDLYCGNTRKAKTHESIWIIYNGKPIHMAFLTFRNNLDIIRVCKNLCEHGHCGHITSSEGGMKTHLADGSRVTVFRPGNSSQWAFFVRKFASASSYSLEELITDKGSEYPIGIIRWSIRGCLNIIFSGDQNSGKTTNTRAAVKEIDRRQPIRSLEADYELYLNDAYSDKNILGTRPSKKMGFPKLIELLKSSDAHTILFGETASLEHAKYLIDLLLAGTKRIITTGHWPTTDEMISYFAHSMGAYGNSGTEDVEAMVARLLHIDIHCVKENDGHRHIDRITEIIPYSRTEKETHYPEGVEGRLDAIAHSLQLLTRKKAYVTRNLIVFENGEYRRVHPISGELADMIIKNLSMEERKAFLEFNKIKQEGDRIEC